MYLTYRSKISAYLFQLNAIMIEFKKNYLIFKKVILFEINLNLVYIVILSITIINDMIFMFNYQPEFPD